MESGVELFSVVLGRRTVWRAICEDEALGRKGFPSPSLLSGRVAGVRGQARPGRADSSRSGFLKPVGRRGPPGQGCEAVATALSEAALLLTLEGRARLPAAPAPPARNLPLDARLPAAPPARRVCGGHI